MRFQEKLPKELYKYSSADHVLHWLPTGSRIQFGHCERPSDVTRYQGAEFDFIGVDELTQFDEETFKYLMSRLRTSKSYVKPKFFASTNPGNIGHAWVKRLWIDRRLEPNEIMAGYSLDDFVFIPSKVQDNEYINKEYIQNLMALPEHQRKMLLDGSWEVYEGQFFENFRQTGHVIPHFDPPDEWPRYRSIDFGRTAPFACLWFTIDYDGVVYVYREYYEAGREIDENVEALIALSGDEHYRYTVVDGSVFAKTGFGESIGQRMQRKGLDMISAHKDRVAGWTAVKQYMNFDEYDEKDKPQLRIMKNCPSLIEEMKHAIYDKNKHEDLDTHQPDHAIDALRYFIMTLRDKQAKHKREDPHKDLNPHVVKLWKKQQADKNRLGVDYTPD